MHKSVWIERLPKGYSVRTRMDTPNGVRATREWRATFAEAQTLKAQLKLSLIAKAQGTLDPTLTSAQVLKFYLDSLRHTHRQVTIDKKQYSLERTFAVFPQWPFTKTVILQIKLHLETKYTNITTISINFREVRTFCNWALRNGYLHENIFAGIKVPPPGESGRKLELAELTGIWAQADDRFKPFLALATATGARKGEMLKARGEHFDLDKGIWTIPAENCKTKHQRTVPISDKVCKLLRPLAQNGQKIFRDWTRDTPGWYLEKACKKAGITDLPRVHDLRHTFASHWQGKPTTLMEIMGWRSLMMLKRYTHLGIEDIRNEVQTKGLILNLL